MNYIETKLAEGKQMCANEKATLHLIVSIYHVWVINFLVLDETMQREEASSWLSWLAFYDTKNEEKIKHRNMETLNAYIDWQPINHELTYVFRRIHDVTTNETKY